MSYWVDGPAGGTPITAANLEANTTTKRPTTTADNTIVAQSQSIVPLTVRGAATHGTDFMRLEGNGLTRPLLKVGNFGGWEVSSVNSFGDQVDFYDQADTQPRVRLGYGGAAPVGIQMGSGSAATDTGFSRTGTRQMALSGSLAQNYAETTGVARPVPLVDFAETTLTVPAGSPPPMISLHRDERRVRSDPLDVQGHMIRSTEWIGAYGGAAPIGTHSSLFAGLVIRNAGSNTNEYCPFQLSVVNSVGVASGGNGTNAGRTWLMDTTMHGPVGVQPHLYTGITLGMHNYYNGSPTVGPSCAIHLTTRPGLANPIHAGHKTAATYPNDVALHITGAAGNSIASLNRNGWTTAIKVGGNGSTWAGESRVGTGIDIADYTAEGLVIGAPKSGAAATAGIRTTALTPPSDFQGGVATKYFTAAPTDASFTATPPNGTIAVARIGGADRLYAKTSAGWKRVDLVT